MPGSRPIIRSGSTLKMDVSQFSLVIANLLINSIQAVAEKGEIHLFTRGSKKNVFILVKDNGLESQGDSPKIFDFMFSTKPTGSGSVFPSRRKSSKTTTGNFCDERGEQGIDVSDPPPDSCEDHVGAKSIEGWSKGIPALPWCPHGKENNPHC